MNGNRRDWHCHFAVRSVDMLCRSDLSLKNLGLLASSKKLEFEHYGFQSRDFWNLGQAEMNSNCIVTNGNFKNIEIQKMIGDNHHISNKQDLVMGEWVYH